MVVSGKHFLQSLAISIGKRCPKKRMRFDSLLKRVSTDPLLLKKLALSVSSSVFIEAVDAPSEVTHTYHLNQKTPGRCMVKLKCQDVAALEACLNGDDLDLIKIWAEQNAVMEGDLATSIIITDALFRYAELIGQSNIPWPLYRLIARKLE